MIALVSNLSNMTDVTGTTTLDSLSQTVVGLWPAPRALWVLLFIVATPQRKLADDSQDSRRLKMKYLIHISMPGVAYYKTFKNHSSHQCP